MVIVVGVVVKCALTTRNIPKEQRKYSNPNPKKSNDFYGGKEYGYINSRNSRIINTVIKSKKGDEYTIEFTIEALDGGQEYINKIKNTDLIQEFNQIKRRLKSALKEKDKFDVLSELKFIK